MKFDPFDINRPAKKKDAQPSRAAELEAAGLQRHKARGVDPQSEIKRIMRENNKPVKMADGGMVDGLNHGQRSRNSNLALDKIEFDADTKMMNAQVRRANADAARNYKQAVLAKSKARMAEPAQEGMLSSIGRKAKAFFAADGGMVEGPGGPTDDMVPAMYSAGEYVLPADTVQAVGKENLDSLRRMTHNKKHKTKVKNGVVHAAGGLDDDMFDRQRKYDLAAKNRPAVAAAPVADPAAYDSLRKRATAGAPLYTLPGALKDQPRENPYNKAGGAFNMMAPENKTQNFASPEAKVLEYNGPNLIDDTPRNITAAQGAATNTTGETEAERKAQLSEIDSQLFGLRGNTNMASKRQMVTGLLGVKRQLTADRMGQLGDADKLATGVSSDNAQMRQGADQFNTGTKLDVEKFNVGAKNENSEGLRRSQAEMMKIAAANDPNSLDNRLKIAANTRAENDELRKAGANADAGQKQRDQYDNSRSKDIMAMMLKADPEMDPAVAKVAADKQIATENLRTKQPNDTKSAALGELGLVNEFEDKLNEGQGWVSKMWDSFDGTASSESSPFYDEKVKPNSLSMNDVSINKRGGLIPFINAITPGGQPINPYLLQGPANPETGVRPSRPLSEEEAEEMKKKRDLLKSGINRKGN